MKENTIQFNCLKIAHSGTMNCCAVLSVDNFFTLNCGGYREPISLIFETSYGVYTSALTLLNPFDLCFFFLIFGGHMSFSWGHWWPCFGPMLTSTLGFKARVDPLLGVNVTTEIDGTSWRWRRRKVYQSASIKIGFKLSYSAIHVPLHRQQAPS